MSLTSTDHNMETIDQGSQVAIAMSDDEADGLIRAACEKDGDLHPKAFDRRMEMRWIRYNLYVDKPERVPSNITHMKRIWSPTKLRGLHLRRDAEAKLFTQGLVLAR